MPVSTRHGEAFEIHEDQLTRIVVYRDRGRVFADLGLTPKGD